MSSTVDFGHSSHGIYWERRGSGPLLTLVIGFGQDSSAWQFVVRELEHDFELVLVDNRGAGRSPNLEESFGLEDLADDVIGVLDELEVSRTAIAGQSMGGAIAQLVALKRPELISELILVNSFARLPTAPRFAFEGVYGLLTHDTALDDVIANLAPWIYSGEFLEVPGRTAELVEAAAANPYPQPVHSYRAQLDAINAFDSSPHLTDIAHPTLVIGGIEDLVAPPTTTNVLADGIPDATLTFLNTGHASHIEAPGQVADTIREFLQRS